MESSDEEELAQLRAQRQNALGGIQLDQQQHDEQTQPQLENTDSFTAFRNNLRPASQEILENNDIQLDNQKEDLRQFFPQQFGSFVNKRSAAKINLQMPRKTNFNIQSQNEEQAQLQLQETQKSMQQTQYQQISGVAKSSFKKNKNVRFNLQISCSAEQNASPQKQSTQQNFQKGKDMIGPPPPLNFSQEKQQYQQQQQLSNQQLQQIQQEKTLLDDDMVGPPIPADVMGPPVPAQIYQQNQQQNNLNYQQQMQQQQNLSSGNDNEMGTAIPQEFSKQYQQDKIYNQQTQQDKLQNPIHDDDDMVGPVVPIEFSQQGQQKNNLNQQRKLKQNSGYGQVTVGPAVPVEFQNRFEKEKSEDSSSDEGSETSEQDLAPQIPCSNEVILSGHTKTVTAVQVDPSGSRVIAGGLDYQVRMYDFNGMKSDLKPFRELLPYEGHPVNSLSWSPTGDMFLAVTGATQAKVYNRDGVQQGEFVRGDMYIRDLRNTKGHVNSLCMGQWHPLDKAQALTCSEDGTLRVWDMYKFQQKTVVKPTLSKPGRVSVTSCAYSIDGKIIAAGLQDGSLQLWNVGGGKFGVSAAVQLVQPPRAQMIEKQQWSYVSRASQVVKQAHQPTFDITSVCFGGNGFSLASRGGDGTVKLWDLRSFKKPVFIAENYPVTYAMTQVAFSPDQSMIMTGVCPQNSQENGGLVFLDADNDLKLVSRVGFDGSVVAVDWNPKINQIVLGVGSANSGGAHVLYDTDMSSCGAMMSIAKAPRKKNPFDFSPAPVIHNPHALPMYRDQWSRKRRREKTLNDPVKTKKPDLGLQILGRSSKKGATGGDLLTQHLLKERGQFTAVKEQMDPRERLLRHPEKDPQYVAYTSAYKETQPDTILEAEEKEENSSEEG